MSFPPPFWELFTTSAPAIAAEPGEAAGGHLDVVADADRERPQVHVARRQRLAVDGRVA